MKNPVALESSLPTAEFSAGQLQPVSSEGLDLITESAVLDLGHNTLIMVQNAIIRI